MKLTDTTKRGRILRGNGHNAVALPDLQNALTAAAAGRVEEQRASRRARPPRLLIAFVACLAFGGTAMATTGLWNPEIGTNAYHGPPSISDTPVPSDLTEVLAVLRRPPTARDRGHEVERTLQEVNPGEGVRPDSVRYLGSGVDGQATILVSAEHTRSFFTEAEPVCVSRPIELRGLDPGVNRSPLDPVSPCFGLDQIMAGEARTGIGGPALTDGPREVMLALGLVPDGVATVIAQFGSAPDRRVAVANNYWEMWLSGPELSNANSEAGVIGTVWRDAEGNIVPQGPPAKPAVDRLVERGYETRKAP